MPEAAAIRRLAPPGMITLRARPDLPGLAAAVQAATGCALPGLRRIEGTRDRGVAWMSPDEWMLFAAPAEVPGVLAVLAAGLDGQHHLAADVSDARAAFRIEGPAAEGVIARLAPVDLPRLPAGEMRRTRLAQVAAALWREEQGFTLVTFRSVADYAHDVLVNAARAAALNG
jgi:sarcosine oxidase subunit gamma